MPDWSYRTLFRPLLSQLPPIAARTLTLRGMGAVSRMPGGALLIKTLGHMEPFSLLKRRMGNTMLGTPVGLGGEVDPDGLAQRALAQLGFGFAWIGPVPATAERDESAGTVRMDHARETIQYPNGPERVSVETAIRSLRDASRHVPAFVRIAPASEATREQAAQQATDRMRVLGAEGAAGFAVDVMTRSRERPWNMDDYAMLIGRVTRACADGKPLLWHLPADCSEAMAAALASALREAGWTGVIIGPGHDDAIANRGDRDDDSRPGSRPLAAGPGQLERALGLVRRIREQVGADFVIQAAAGIHEPIDALRALDAGADHVVLNSGFVYAGPGLPKRVNDAILYEQMKRSDKHSDAPEPSFWRHWGWMCLLGIGMMAGGLIAWMIAVTTVLLPYDEDYLGMTWRQLRDLHPHLLHFMSHDRITLAGTMISIGILYYMLGKHGMRHGQHWARTAVLVSCLIGFPSFFLYLGYGYFDPLHAGAALFLLPLFLLSIRRNPDRPSREPVNLRNDRLWRRAVWGQLCFVALGIALAVGGLTIAGVGVTRVFVPSDLVYLGLTPEQLDAINPRLIPLIAHDRAGFGGALLADAAALLATALWGIQQGARWLWATLLLGGAPAFYAAISVHFNIGYVDTIHLLPAYFALFLYAAGLILLYPYMMRKPEAYVSESGAASA